MIHIPDIRPDAPYMHAEGKVSNERLVMHLRYVLSQSKVDGITGLGVATIGVDTLRLVIEALES